jgi:hypothetical protein
LHRRREPREDIWLSGSFSVRLDKGVLIRTEETHAPPAVGSRQSVHPDGISGRDEAVVLYTVRACSAREPVDLIVCEGKIQLVHGEVWGEVLAGG